VLPQSNLCTAFLEEPRALGCSLASSRDWGCGLGLGTSKGCKDLGCKGGGGRSWSPFTKLSCTLQFHKLLDGTVLAEKKEKHHLGDTEVSLLSELRRRCRDPQLMLRNWSILGQQPHQKTALGGKKYSDAVSNWSYSEFPAGRNGENFLLTCTK